MGKAGGFEPLTKSSGQIFVCCCDPPSLEIFLALVSLRAVCCSLGRGETWGETVIRRLVPSLPGCHFIGMEILSSTAFRRSLNLMSLCLSLLGYLKKEVGCLLLRPVISPEDMIFWLQSSPQNPSDSPESPKVADIWVHTVYFCLVI